MSKPNPADLPAGDCQTWYVIHGEKETGPFSMRQLAVMAGAHDIDQDDLIQNSQGLCKRWTKASAFIFLQSEFRKSDPIGPQQPLPTKVDSPTLPLELTQPERTTWPLATEIDPKKDPTKKIDHVAEWKPWHHVGGTAASSSPCAAALHEPGHTNLAADNRNLGKIVLGIGVALVFILALIWPKTTDGRAHSGHPKGPMANSPTPVAAYNAYPTNAFSNPSNAGWVFGSADNSRDDLSYRNSLAAPASKLQGSPSVGLNRYYDYNYRPAVSEHYVQGYIRRDGIYVSGHYRTNPDDSFWNNWSSKGNVNPHTGKVGTKMPSGFSTRAPRLPSLKSARR
jgi:hypothetical protein